MKNAFTQSIQQAISVLRADGIIAYPSDSIPGLGCLPHSKKALQKIINLKQRSSNKAFILLGTKRKHFDTWVETKWLDWIEEQKVSTNTTWVVPCKDIPHKLLTGHYDTIAIRFVKHPVVEALCETCGAITSTSINIESEKSLTHLSQLSLPFAQQIDYIIDCGDRFKEFESGKGSTIVDANSGNILRK